MHEKTKAIITKAMDSNEPEINLEFCVIKDEDAETIAKLIESGKYTTELKLNLKGSTISPKALKRIVESIQTQNLSTLALILPMMRDPSFEYEHNPEFLREMMKILSGFFLTDKGPSALTIDLGGYNFSEGLELKLLAAAIDTSGKYLSNFTLNIGDITRHVIDIEFQKAVISLFRVLVKHTHNLNLNLDKNEVGPDTLNKIEKIIQSDQCRAILNINLLDNLYSQNLKDKARTRNLIEKNNKKNTSVVLQMSKNHPSQPQDVESLFQAVKRSHIENKRLGLVNEVCRELDRGRQWIHVVGGESLGPAIPAQTIAEILQTEYRRSQIAAILASSKYTSGFVCKFCSPPIGDEGAIAIANLIESGKCPENISFIFFNGKIGNKGAIALAKALRSGRSPKHITLDLSGNKIGFEGAKAFCETISSDQWSDGYTLNLLNTEMGEEGSELLSQAFEEKYLQQLPSESSTSSTEAHPIHIEENQYRNFKVTYKIDEKTVAKVQELRRQKINREITEEREKKKQKIKNAIQSASKSLKSREPVIQVYVDSTLIADEDAEAIATIIKSNDFAPELIVDLNYSEISLKGLQIILQSIPGKRLSNLSLKLSMMYEKDAGTQISPEFVFGKAKIFSEFFQSGNYPETLSFDLSINNLGASEFEMLTRAIKTSEKCPSDFTFNLGGDILHHRCALESRKSIQQTFLTLFQVLVKRTRKLNLKIDLDFFESETIEKIKNIIQSDQCCTILNTDLFNRYYIKQAKDRRNISDSTVSLAQNLIERNNKKNKKQYHENNILDFAMLIRGSNGKKQPQSNVANIPSDVIRHIGTFFVGNSIDAVYKNISEISKIEISKTKNYVFLKFNTLESAKKFAADNNTPIISSQNTGPLPLVDQDRIPGKFLVRLPIFNDFYEKFRNNNLELNYPALSSIPDETTQYSPPKRNECRIF